ncbi:hypothetical protein D3C71_2167390 [compost metagenome]
MVTITLKELYEEGRLTRGDILTHSEKGNHWFQYVDMDGALVVRNQEDQLIRWFIELPDGCELVKLQ